MRLLLLLQVSEAVGLVVGLKISLKMQRLASSFFEDFSIFCNVVMRRDVNMTSLFLNLLQSVEYCHVNYLRYSSHTAVANLRCPHFCTVDPSRWHFSASSKESPETAHISSAIVEPPPAIARYISKALVL